MCTGSPGMKGNVRRRTDSRIRCLFQGRKLITQRWQAKELPTGKEWSKVIDDMVTKEEFIYPKGGNKKTFQNMWKQYIEVETRERGVRDR